MPEKTFTAVTPFGTFSITTPRTQRFVGVKQTGEGPSAEYQAFWSISQTLAAVDAEPYEWETRSKFVGVFPVDTAND